MGTVVTEVQRAFISVIDERIIPQVQIVGKGFCEGI